MRVRPKLRVTLLPDCVIEPLLRRLLLRGSPIWLRILNGMPFVLWRETEAQARAEVSRIMDQTDMVAAQNWAAGLSAGSESMNDFTLKMLAFGAGALPVIGTAARVADNLARLYALGMDGVLIEFLDHYEGTKRFGQEIVPLLRQMEVG